MCGEAAQLQLRLFARVQLCARGLLPAVKIPIHLLETARFSLKNS